jgi:hypothetical protein
VEQIMTDVIELADTNTLDLLPSRAVVQEVLDALDERHVQDKGVGSYFLIPATPTHGLVYANDPGLRCS